MVKLDHHNVKLYNTKRTISSTVD